MPLRPRSTKNIEVLFEDDFLIAFNKPAGLLVVPTPRKENNTLESIVNRQHASLKDFPKLYPCHRLDRDTSGVILFAKGKRSRKLMAQLFKDRKVTKTYTAFVHGQLSKNEGQIRRPIKDFDQKKYNKNTSPKFAITKYKTLLRKKRYSIVEVSPTTGRTNQIRIHFAQIGHPLVGERKYAFSRDFKLKFKRTALHARSLKWKHPIYHKVISIQSNLPNDMEVFIARNRN